MDRRMVAPRTADVPGREAGTLRWIGVILGVGVIGTLDQVVLHEMLQWHHFYVHTTLDWRLFIDGIFHAVTAGLLLLGALLLWLRRHRISRAGATGRARGVGILRGMGGFNLYDGTVQHKLLQLHPVREGVDNIWPYDLAFNGVAVLLLVAGWLLWRGVGEGRTARRPPAGGRAK